DADAVECRNRAIALHAEEDIFNRGLEHLNRGELQEAWFEFDNLPPNSVYRTRPEVRDTAQRFARAQLELARGEVESHPNDALHKAQFVAAMPGITDQQRNDARSLEREARRHSGDHSQPDHNQPDHNAPNPRHQQQAQNTPNTPPRQQEEPGGSDSG